MGSNEFPLVKGLLFAVNLNEFITGAYTELTMFFPLFPLSLNIYQRGVTLFLITRNARMRV
ncbi:hypothetical protein PcaKH15_01520 [Parageobacillus caldoxylosilyticus]|nr:hypothetical protein PcaKH15_01520 [Parageobacillus caldoxylosilyticus]BDG38014.1 hypothetical protein PcaKH16_01530 [Parageobacillus caldoxylosilyticus]